MLSHLPRHAPPTPPAGHPPPGGADRALPHPPAPALHEAEQALRIYHVTEHTLEPLTLALSALVYAD
ncbi:hypothetical protein, partial [Streptomyces zhihengii]